MRKISHLLIFPIYRGIINLIERTDFMADTRIPTQKRSIEKYGKIVEKGFELMCEKGYYNTSTNDIADYADVSIGIIYQYFKDKKEIFIEGVKNYSNKIMYPMIDILDNEKINFDHMDELLNSMIDKFIETHTFSKKAHEELMAMSHLDNAVSKIFKDSEINLTKKIVTILKNNNIEITNAKEKVHIIIGIVENLCHEIAYHQHNEIDYNIMKMEVIKIVSSILKSQKI